jgi:hypothetical protein
MFSQNCRAVVVVAALPLLPGCPHNIELEAPLLQAAPANRVRLVVTGDTGALPDANDPHRATPAQRAALAAAIQAEHPDAVFALGDLVYDRVPACNGDLGAAERELFEQRIGQIYLGNRSNKSKDNANQSPGTHPTYLVVGNHDAAHTRSRAARRERCLMAWAAEREGIELPALQYVVDWGFARVVVIDSNLRDSGDFPAEALRESIGAGWTLVMAHHELRTFGDKEVEGFWEPPPPGPYFLAQGLLPDLYLNGHAHFMQFGVYDLRVTDDGRIDSRDLPNPRLLPAVTLGSGSKLRESPNLSDAPDGPFVPELPFGEDGPRSRAEKLSENRGIPRFSTSQIGYGVVELGPDQLRLQIKGIPVGGGPPQVLYCWERTRSDPGGELCPISAPEETP